MGYSFNEQFRRDINTEFDRRIDHKANFQYQYQTKPVSVEPFYEVPLFQSDWWALLRDFNFYFYPSSFTFRTEVNRMYQENKQRNTDNLSFELPTTYNKAFTMRRQYDLAWNLTKAITFDYTATANTRVDELYGPASADSVQASIKESFWAGGRPTQFQQGVNLSYQLPFDKLPATDWITSDVRYAGTLNWMTNSQVALNAASDTLRLGSTVQNSATINGSAQLNFVNLYNKIPYLQKINGQGMGRRNSRGPVRRGCPWRTFGRQAG